MPETQVNIEHHRVTTNIATVQSSINKWLERRPKSSSEVAEEDIREQDPTKQEALDAWRLETNKAFAALTKLALRQSATEVRPAQLSDAMENMGRAFEGFKALSSDVDSENIRTFHEKIGEWDELVKKSKALLEHAPLTSSAAAMASAWV